MRIRHVLWLVVLAVVWIGASDALADSSTVAADNEPLFGQAASSAAGDEVAAPSMTEDILPSLSRIGISLLVIIAVIYATVFLLKKLSGSRMSGVGRGKVVRVIEQTYLAPKKSVCLLKMADRAVLVGITDNTISMLTECEWDAIPAENLPAQRTAGFPGMLSDAAGRLFGARGSKGGERETIA